MSIILHFAEKGGTRELKHDLHFQAPKYENTHVVVYSRGLIYLTLKEFNKPSPGLLKLLAESGDTPGYTVPAPSAAPTPTQDTKKRKLDFPEDFPEDARQSKESSAPKKKGRFGKQIDMEFLAGALQRLNEDDLLQVVRIVNDHKTPDMYVKNDLEGNFLLKYPFICRGPN
jgi:transcription initiation factor TFIID/TFIIF subunit